MQMTESAELCRISKLLSENLLFLEPVNPLTGPVCLQDTDSEIRAQRTLFAMHMRALRPGMPPVGISCVKREGARRTQDGCREPVPTILIQDLKSHCQPTTIQKR